MFFIVFSEYLVFQLCSHFGYCRRRIFSPEIGGPRFCGHVQIEKSVFLCVFAVFYVLFNELSSFVPTLDIAAGAFSPAKGGPICFGHVQIEKCVFMRF